MEKVWKLNNLQQWNKYLGCNMIQCAHLKFCLYLWEGISKGNIFIFLQGKGLEILFNGLEKVWKKSGTSFYQMCMNPVYIIEWFMAFEPFVWSPTFSKSHVLLFFGPNPTFFQVPLGGLEKALYCQFFDWYLTYLFVRYETRGTYIFVCIPMTVVLHPRFCFSFTIFFI